MRMNTAGGAPAPTACPCCLPPCSPHCPSPPFTPLPSPLPSPSCMPLPSPSAPASYLWPAPGTATALPLPASCRWPASGTATALLQPCPYLLHTCGQHQALQPCPYLFHVGGQHQAPLQSCSPAPTCCMSVARTRHRATALLQPCPYLLHICGQHQADDEGAEGLLVGGGEVADEVAILKWGQGGAN